jgi:hypothetical protein
MRQRGIISSRQALPRARIVSVGFNADLTFWLNGFALGIEEQVMRRALPAVAAVAAEVDAAAIL